MVPNPSKPLRFLLCHFHPPGEFIEAVSCSVSRKPFIEGKKNLKICFSVLYLEGTVVRAGIGRDPKELVHF